MKYYKRNNGRIYEERDSELPVSENCVEITQEEYIAAVHAINAKILAQ